ncbi:MAG: FecR domain-containing protein [Polyangia bacterium]
MLEARLVEEHEPDGDELRLAERHAAECDDCAALLVAIESLADDDGELEDRYVERALDARFRRARGRSMALLAGAAAVAAAAAIVVVSILFSSEAERGNQPAAPALALEAASAGTLVAADGTPSRAPTAGETVESAGRPVLLHGGDFLELGLAEHTRISLETLERDRVEVFLEQGSLAVRLDPDAKAELAVDTKLGRVKVAGTVFMVQLSSSSLRVDVVEGSVRTGIPAEEGRTRLVEVAAGRSLVSPRAETSLLSPERRREIMALLEPWRAERSPRVATGKGAVDDSAERAEASGPVAEESDAESGGSEKSSARSTARAGRKSPPSAEPREVPGAEELIREARSARKSGNWNAAAGAYGRVLELHGGSPEAMTVLVPLAEIELEHLHRPDLALHHFGLYQRSRPRGPLAEEAAWGRCFALRALGRLGGEINALRSFLERYPKSIHASEAKTRLDKID